MNNDNRQFVDELLDASLERFSSVELRAGLQGRILAGVAARNHASRRRNWRMGLAFATVAILVVSIAVLIPRHPAVSVAPPAPVAIARPEKAAPSAPSVRALPSLAIVRRPKGVRQRPQQFPTPAPLSEQEKLLLLYVQGAPKSVLATPLPTTEEDLEIPDIKTAALEIKDLPGANDGE